jgi:hypothetical protein
MARISGSAGSAGSTTALGKFATELIDLLAQMLDFAHGSLQLSTQTIALHTHLLQLLV